MEVQFSVENDEAMADVKMVEQYLEKINQKSDQTAVEVSQEMDQAEQKVKQTSQLSASTVSQIGMLVNTAVTMVEGLVMMTGRVIGPVQRAVLGLVHQSIMVATQVISLKLAGQDYIGAAILGAAMITIQASLIPTIAMQAAQQQAQIEGARTTISSMGSMFSSF